MGKDVSPFMFTFTSKLGVLWSCLGWLVFIMVVANMLLPEGYLGPSEEFVKIQTYLVVPHINQTLEHHGTAGCPFA